MGAAKIGEAERLARHNAEMRLALAENLSLAEARTRLARERYQRLTRCGTDAREATPDAERKIHSPPDAVARPAAQYWWQKL